MRPPAGRVRPRGLLALPWVRSWRDPGLGGVRAGGAVMRAVIVCESMFGSTQKVAEAIAGGLADCAEVSVVPVTSAGASLTARISWWRVVPPTPAGCPGRVPGRWPGSWRGSRGASLSWYRALSAARECADGSHRTAGWRSPAPLSVPASRDCRRSLAGRRSPSAGTSPTTGRASRRHPGASSSRA